MANHSRLRSLLACLFLLPVVLPAAPAEPAKIGTARQLFVDDQFIDMRRNVELQPHQPVTREVAIAFDQPWENGVLAYVSVMKDGDRYVMYYRGTNADDALAKTGPAGIQSHNWTYMARAESKDGITWTKPSLGVVSFNGSKDNNLVWPNDTNKPWRTSNYPGTDFFPFIDGNPACPPEQRYKALANLGEYALVALVSPDGINWKPLQTEPVIAYLKPDPMMDPPSISFWDPNTKQYVAYCRNWINGRIRGSRRLTSPDFIHWSEPVQISYIGGEVEHLYTTMAVAYDRAPLYFYFSKRFARTDRMDKIKGGGFSEIVFLSSRDGVHFNHSFMEPFVGPGLDQKNWGPRGIMMGRGILQTSPTELSLYYNENYGHPTARVRRATIRPDGFVSVHAPWEGGEFTTKPFVLEGDELEINYSTSVAGFVRVEILDADGNPIPGFRAEDCYEIFGDELDRTVVWKKGHADILDENHVEKPISPANVSFALGGQVVRLRFVMKAAHLYSFRFK